MARAERTVEDLGGLGDLVIGKGDAASRNRQALHPMSRRRSLVVVSSRSCLGHWLPPLLGSSADREPGHGDLLHCPATLGARPPLASSKDAVRSGEVNPASTAPSTLAICRSIDPCRH